MDEPSAQTVLVLSDVDAVAAEAAERLIARVTSRERAAVCLTGGSGPTKLYQRLAEPETAARIPWPGVHWFIGDERFVPSGDRLHNMSAACALFLEKYAAPGTVHPIPTEAATPEAAARAYERTLMSFHGVSALTKAEPLFDLVLMGVGPDGHTASLFPNAPALEETERWVVGVPQANVAPFVPRITLTLATLGSCREMLFLLTGPDKQSIYARVAAGEDLPAARAHSVQQTTWLLDRAAAGAA